MPLGKVHSEGQKHEGGKRKGVKKMNSVKESRTGQT